MKLKTTAFLLASALSTSAIANETYFGLNYLATDVDFGFVSVNPGAIETKYGGFVSDNVAIEGRAGFGLTDDSVNGVDVEVDSILGIYAVYNFQPKGDFNPYALIGYTRGELSASSSFGSDSESENDVSFGLGADFSISDASAFNLEWIQYIDKSGGEVTGFSAGMVWKF